MKGTGTTESGQEPACWRRGSLGERDGVGERIQVTSCISPHISGVSRNRHVQHQGRSLLRPAQTRPQARRHFPLSHRTSGGRPVSDKAGLPGAPGPLTSAFSAKKRPELDPRPLATPSLQSCRAQALYLLTLSLHWGQHPVVGAKPSACSTFLPNLSQ